MEQMVRRSREWKPGPSCSEWIHTADERVVFRRPSPEEAAVPGRVEVEENLACLSQ